MKKIVSVFLSLFMLVLSALPVSAISISEGNGALNEQMLDGQHGSQDYVYFSPVKGNSDSTKYPLLVWLHGAMSGYQKREQLGSYKFSNWASDEYQARFENAGALSIKVCKFFSVQSNFFGCIPLRKVFFYRTGYANNNCS